MEYSDGFRCRLRSTCSSCFSSRITVIAFVGSPDLIHASRHYKPRSHLFIDEQTGHAHSIILCQRPLASAPNISSPTQYPYTYSLSVACRFQASLLLCVYIRSSRRLSAARQSCRKDVLELWLLHEDSTSAILCLAGLCSRRPLMRRLH